MNENIQVQELFLVDMTIQLMGAIVVYYCHSNVKTFMFLELKKKNKVFDVFFSWIPLWYVFKKLPLQGS